MTQPLTPEDVARRAIDGDRDALDHLVRELQGDIYGLGAMPFEYSVVIIG